MINLWVAQKYRYQSGQLGDDLTVLLPNSSLAYLSSGDIDLTDKANKPVGRVTLAVKFERPNAVAADDGSAAKEVIAAKEAEKALQAVPGMTDQVNWMHTHLQI